MSQTGGSVPVQPALSELQAELQQGVAFHQRGMFAEAERLYEEVLKREPSHFDALHLLGVVALQTRRTERGVALIREAIKLNANIAVAHVSLANGLKDLARFEDALASYDQAIALKPDDAGAYYSRGILQYFRKQYEDALACYDRAIALKPDFVTAHNNRAIALVDMKRFEDALASFNKTIALKPDYAEAHLNRGVALVELARFDEALASCDKAIALKPNSGEAFIVRGVALKELSRFDEALTSYDRAIALKPNDPMAFYNRGNALKERGQQAEAVMSYERALALKPDYAEARLASCMAQLPILYLDEGEINKRRAAYRERLEALCSDFDRQKQPDWAAAIGSSQPFFLAYQGYNDRELQSLYGSLVCRIMAQKFPSVALSRPPRPGEPIWLGVVSGFFRQHSNWKIPIKGWLSQIDRRRFQVFGYHTSAKQDAETAKAISLCDRFVQGPLLIDRWRKEILGDAPHVLIYPEVGMDPISLQLAALRMAPIQCNSWGHPETSGMPTLDYYLSSDLMEPPDAAEHYSERLIRLPNLSIFYDPIEIEAVSTTRAELGLGSDASVFWCGQSLYKYLPQYDHVFAKIATLVGACQFVFLRSTAQKATELFQERLERAFADCDLKASDHCVFLDRLSAGRFIGALSQCDVFLDSIGWSGCNSTLESLAHDLPIVTMRGQLMRGRHSSAILQMMGIAETIAELVEDYISVAARLANDPRDRQALGRKIAIRKHALYRDRQCISAFEDFLERAVRQHAV